jgi:Domain of unknown function (DUF4404)
MPTPTLRDSLIKLRRELENHEELDDDTRQQLAEIADTIDRVLNESHPDIREAHASIEDAALGFEARHPSFARVLSEVTDALAKLGI